VMYNVSVNNGWFVGMALTGIFATKVDNFRVENNTVVQYLPHEGWGADRLFYHGETIKPENLLLRNNIFSVSGWDIADYPGFAHDHNLYDLQDSSELGFPLGQDEIVADPLFADPSDADFHLLTDSPAIDAGQALDYFLDFDNCTVPAGQAPDLGAFEYGTDCTPRPLFPPITETIISIHLPVILSAVSLN
jgi:hypothetical protein